MKVFTGAETEALAAARRVFTAAKLTKPEATRKGSAEMYLVASGRRGFVAVWRACSGGL